MSQDFFYPPGSSNTVVIPPGGATAANQQTQITSEQATQASVASIDTKTPSQGQKTMANSSPVVIASDQSAVPVSGPLTDAQLRATPVPVSISSGITNPLPVTDAAAEASLASIDAKLTNPLPISGTVTANAGTNLNTSALSLEATQLAFSAKSASAFINNPFDETVITYVGASTNIATVVYKLASATVNTLTLTYDGSNRLIDVVKT